MYNRKLKILILNIPPRRSSQSILWLKARPKTLYTCKGSDNQERPLMITKRNEKLRWETILEKGECAFMHSSSNK
jgi:hypothetical protein